MHPALLASRPEKTIDISFSLRQDPLEQALFGEYMYYTFAYFVYVYTYIPYICIFGKT